MASASYYASGCNTFELAQPLPTFHALKAGRERLPVTKQLAKFESLFMENDVVVLSGGTGSGKTTQIPQYVAYLSRRHKISGRIACTQPRRLAATRVAERVAQEAGCELGAQVGYQIRGKDKSSEGTRLIYVTDGLLVAQAFHDPMFGGYHTLIIDEVHECNANIYLLLALARRAVKERLLANPKLKIIIMSATMNVDKFIKYFDGYAKAVAMHMPDEAYPVNVNYLAEIPQTQTPGGGTQARVQPQVSDFVEAAYQVVAYIAQKLPAGNILVFMPGSLEVEKACRRISNQVGGVQAIPLYSALSETVQSDAFETSHKDRICIVTTNIAETSLTIPDVVYVIDTGLEKSLRWAPRLGAYDLSLGPISKANALQRTGRCGRTRPGVCFRLYTFQDFSKLRDEPAPEIHRDDVSPVFLKALAFDFKAADLPFIDQPPTECVIGYLDSKLEITNDGKLAGQSPFDPMWASAINIARRHRPHCVQQIVGIAALRSSMHPIFMVPLSYQKVAHKMMTVFAYPLSDHITELNALYAYLRAGEVLEEEEDLNEWCHRHFLDRRVLDEVVSVRDLYLEREGIEEGPDSDVQVLSDICWVLARAFFRHCAFSTEASNPSYRTVHGNFEAVLGVDSMLNTGFHPWIIYDKFSMGRLPYLEKATAIDPAWIADLPYFQDDRLKKDWHGNIVQTRLKEELDRVRAAM
ncbi:P-loop containing nucleoside triphosphate hydrolase protein [Nemania sp. FL0916]|nr:P-loop containing nucleoside triphosphate hydrolase protein [Nemania sp. FL0916]